VVFEENERIHTVGLYGVEGRGLVEAWRGRWVIIRRCEEGVGLRMRFWAHNTLRGAGGMEHRGEREMGEEEGGKGD
jgi:hypothetical protein